MAATLLVRRIEETKLKVTWPITILSTALVIVTTAAVAIYLSTASPKVLEDGQTWILVTVLLAATVLSLCRGHALLGSGALLFASLIIGFHVNPFYVGVFDLRETDIGETIAEIHDSEPDSGWVGVGNFIPTAMLVESGVQAYNGMQTSPSEEMWDDIDPDDEYEFERNRLANVNWIAGGGEPVVMIPVRDQILISFDSCSEFSQENVDYVLADTGISQPCLTEVTNKTEGATTLWIYEVTH